MNRYPEIIYIQVDGGSENANQCNLINCEMLVINGLSKKVIFSRLPTGHGHGDDDAMFGVIKKAIKGVPMLTWDSFKVQVE